MPSIPHIHQLQCYALNEANQLVKVSLACKDDGSKYFCPYCEQEMIAKCGNKRRWHFAHKAEPCSYDQYLHSLAERRIKDWFDQSEHIDLYLLKYKMCDRFDRCPFYCPDKCSSYLGKNSYDLKKYFTDCELEHKFGGFVADIFCHNKKNEAKPLFLEINVKHECTKEKKDSDIHIIEFKINSEEDIDTIVGSSSLNEGGNIKLYNFRQTVYDSKEFSRPVLKYSQISDIECYLNINEYNCQNYNDSHHGCYEITIPTDKCEGLGITEEGFKTMCQAITYKKGLSSQNCNICAYRPEGLGKDCLLYTKRRISQDQRKYNGVFCPKFCKSEFLLNKSEQDMNTHEKYLSIWSLDPKNK